MIAHNNKGWIKKNTDNFKEFVKWKHQNYNIILIIYLYYFDLKF